MGKWGAVSLSSIPAARIVIVPHGIHSEFTSFHI
jgi:hypothetical protein